MCVAGLVAFSCTDKYDLDTRQPSGLNTIYGYMQDQGNYKNFLQLIDDLGQTEYMSKTGSVTLFIADDDAFAKFFQSNEWGVSSYNELSMTQKKLLLNSAMIPNVYPVSLLSTASSSTTSIKGEVCRRPTTQSLYDSVQVVSTSSSDMPSNSHWDKIRSNRSEIVLYRDASGSAPMLSFTPMFITSSRLEYSDFDFLYGQPEGTLEAEIYANEPGSYINRSKILSSQFCKNGYVHVVDKVITPLENMAELIRTNGRTNIYSNIVERFSAPWSTRQLTEDYNLAKNTDVDSVFVKRYFANRSTGSSDTGDQIAFTEDVYEAGMEGGEILKFDPGWNRYVSQGQHNTSDPLMEDMAVMMAPTDEAVIDWFDNGGGKVIKDQYGTLENTPSSVLSKLVNVNMQNSLVASLPSRFATVENDANEQLGITKDAIDQVLLGCNGVVYVTNKVFPPAEYSSVLFPAVIDVDNLSVFRNGVGNMQNTNTMQFDTYLNSMVSRYTLVLPTNDAMAQYIDPVSLGQQQPKLWEFKLNPDKNNMEDKLYVNIYNITLDEFGNWTKMSEDPADTKGRTGELGTKNTEIKNRLQDILDNCIGIEPIQDGKMYYQTKGNHFIKLGGLGTDEGGVTASTVSGGLAEMNETPANVLATYHMENGTSLVTDALPLSTTQSAADVLAAHQDEFSEFYEMVVRSGSTALSYNPASTGSNNFYAASKANGNLVNVTVDTKGVEKTYQLLNAFHYTLYAPTNAAMQKAYADGLPSLEDLADAEAWDEAQKELEDQTNVKADSAEHIRSVMRDFVKYHVQLNSIYIDKGFKSGRYESAKSNLVLQVDTVIDGVTYYKKDEATGFYDCLSASPFRIEVTEVTDQSLTVKDAMGNTQIIDRRADGLYNLQAREYWLGDGNSGVRSVDAAKTISNSSSVVIHAIDQPLYYNYDPNASEAEKLFNQFHYIPRKIAAEQD